ncbi:NADH-quinone oxidoreductase subunit NuoH [Desulfobacterium sp. N47]|uniref:NADH-quinone oxidoreductase subunit NuoH n=1 Tax=Desulfobacterium sp. N47 TaxID=3115210 RepID=UPI003CB6CC9A
MTQLPIIKDIYGFLGPDLLVGVVGLLLVLIFVPLNSAFLVWVERKVAGHIQLRPGPMEVGPHGILQSLIDAVKLMCKEMITPDLADKPLFWMAPCIVVIPAIVCFVVIPFSPVMQIRELNVGILLIFAFSSISGLSIMMGGWASNNKYSLIGAIRAVAQSIAYEIPLLLATMPVILMSNSFKMSKIVADQSPVWNFILQPVAAIIFIICSTAETNRAPFDLVEAESELVSGFHTEYTGMRDALFFMAEYTAMFIASSMAVVLFFGGWHGPFFSGLGWFVLKAYFLVFVTVWIRWTFPRLRFDQLMNFAWKVLIPIALLNLLVTAVVIKVL